MSLKVLRSFIVRNEEDPSLGLDASRIHSKQCFNAWLLKYAQGKNHGVSLDLAYRRFYRILCNHASGVDGRTPFLKREESAVLAVLREAKHWPCYPAHITLGESGFRSLGYHEKQDRKRQRLAFQHLSEEATMQTSIRNLMRNNCTEFSPQEFAFVSSFLTSFPAYVRSFNQGLTIEIWRRCLSVLRLCSLATSPTTCIGRNTPSGYAQELCLRRETPKQFIAVCDVLAGPSIAARNALALTYFGNNSGTMLPHSEDLAQVLFACFWVMLRPGKQYALPQIRLYCSGKFSFFNLNLWLDPETCFFVCITGHML